MRLAYGYKHILSLYTYYNQSMFNIGILDCSKKYLYKGHINQRWFLPGLLKPVITIIWFNTIPSTPINAIFMAFSY